MGGAATKSDSGATGVFAESVDVNYRTWSQVDEEERVWHIIRILSEETIDNAIIQVYGVDNEGKSIGLNIAEVAGGYQVRDGETFVDNVDYADDDSELEAAEKQVKNAIGGVIINAKTPLILKVRFNSAIKYSLRINSEKIVKYDENK